MDLTRELKSETVDLLRKAYQKFVDNGDGRRAQRRMLLGSINLNHRLITKRALQRICLSKIMMQKARMMNSKAFTFWRKYRLRGAFKMFSNNRPECKYKRAIFFKNHRIMSLVFGVLVRHCSESVAEDAATLSLAETFWNKARLRRTLYSLSENKKIHRMYQYARTYNFFLIGRKAMEMLGRFAISSSERGIVWMQARKHSDMSILRRALLKLRAKRTRRLMIRHAMSTSLSIKAKILRATIREWKTRLSGFAKQVDVLRLVSLTRKAALVKRRLKNVFGKQYTTCVSNVNL